MANPFDTGGGGGASGVGETTDQLIYDKPYDLVGETDPTMVQKIDEMFAALYHGVSMLDYLRRFGSLPSEFFSSISDQLNINNGVTVNSISTTNRNTEWTEGPWTMDQQTPGDFSGTVLLADSTVLVSGTTYNNWAPPNIDKLIAIEASPSGNCTISGIQQYALIHRMLVIRNISNFTITLSNESSSSTAKNRFKFPLATDVQIDGDQSVVLFYSSVAQRWTLLVTTTTAGGIVSSSGVSKITFSLSESQIEGLAATPLTLVAGVANQIVIPISCTVVVNCTSAYTNNPSWQVIWTGITGVTLMTASSNLSGATGKRVHAMVPGSVNPSGANYPGGLGIQLNHSVALTGTATGVVSGFVTFTYATGSSV